MLHGRNNRFFFPWEQMFFQMKNIFIVPPMQHGNMAAIRNLYSGHPELEKVLTESDQIFQETVQQTIDYRYPGGVGGGGIGSIFAGYVPLASQNPFPLWLFRVTFCLCINLTKSLSILISKGNVMRLVNIKSKALQLFL